jgi:alkyl sulfatase BDS1-like metallo-beta-lactamase superfamily hydrolase
MIARFGADTELVFASHHWPTWGHEESLSLLRSQRDTYRYLHDETLRLANHGETMLEIAEELELPPALARTWSSRGYYGSVNHNVKAIYQRYLGFFDGNPATLHPHPPVEAARRYVAYMGGADAILERARVDHEAGDDRWVAEVVKHVVFADPTTPPPGSSSPTPSRSSATRPNRARGATSTSPERRSCVTGSRVLPTPTTSSPDVVAAMPTGLILDYLAIRLKHPEAADLRGHGSIVLSDVDERHLLELSNGVLHHRAIADDEEVAADATVTATRVWLDGAPRHGRPRGRPRERRGRTDRGRPDAPADGARAARRLPVLVRHRHPLSGARGRYASSPRRRPTSTASRRPSTPSLR